MLSIISNFFERYIGNIQNFFFLVPVLLISLPFHEFAHAAAATVLGDNTARRAGRLTLNPLAHLDPIGAICLLLFHFGWAKPVPVNPNLMRSRKTGMLITSLAGPVSNVILAFLFAILIKIFFPFIPYDTVQQAVYILFLYFVNVNIGLAIFNLLPIPPLDGSNILSFILPERLQNKMFQYERYFFLIVIVLLITGVLSIPISFLTNSALYGMSLLLGVNLSF